ncbi:hypothetical protein O0L34_g12787 [Tuta absoluta]|nr:hypothetical protein O0L34_g12787 [Tuta absoluta]
MESRSSSEVWNHFKKKGLDKAQCNRCPKILCCKGSSTSGLARHLLMVHNINIKEQFDQSNDETSSKTTSNSASSPTPGSSKSLPQPSKKRKASLIQTSIDKHVNKPRSVNEMVSRLAASDGISIRTITNSEVIRGFVSQASLNIPKCESQVMKMIVDYAEEKRQEISAILNKYVKNHGRLSITLDEWTSIRNRRYFNINLHGGNGKVYNLGLTYIPGKCGSSETRTIVDTVLTEFGISFERDIVATTSDGPNVMKKFGRESPAEMVLCMNHAIHLAVTDVLYRKRATSVKDSSDSEESDSDSYDDSDRGFVQLVDDIQNRDIRPDLKKVLEDTRKIVNVFRRSPLKNAILQEYVRLEHNKEMSLCRDVKTRWNSIETMISRFLEVKNCIKKALIDLDSGNLWCEQNLTVLEDLMKITNPIKLAVEALSSQKADMLVCEAVITTLLGRLKKFESSIAFEFSDRLTQRIEKSESESSPNESLLVTAEGQREISFAEELQDAIQNVLKDTPTPRTRFARLKKDFDLFTSSVKRTPNLDLLYNALRTIMPTSTESERTFSVSGNFATKIRSRLSDKSLSSLVFLKHYFKQQE